MKKYLEETALLDYSHPDIQIVVNQKKWMQLAPADRLKAVYSFVRNDIPFGYNEKDDLKASQILADGYGQCNTKATLLMALLRAVNLPNRIHGFTIDKRLQKGAITGIWYTMAPKNILHSWVEVKLKGTWYFLEGVILDQMYLDQIQKQNTENNPNFCGFGAFTKDFTQPVVEWDFNHTFIQEKGINQDFGLFNSPDEFYQKQPQNLKGIRKIVFENIVRKKMNANVVRLRGVTKTSSRFR